jgi:hypothetical protein
MINGAEYSPKIEPHKCKLFSEKKMVVLAPTNLLKLISLLVLTMKIDKGAKTIQWRKDRFFQQMILELNSSTFTCKYTYIYIYMYVYIYLYVYISTYTPLTKIKMDHGPTYRNYKNYYKMQNYKVSRR